jgi:uncharacterized coiled-coil protein SlyX
LKNKKPDAASQLYFPVETGRLPTLGKDQKVRARIQHLEILKTFQDTSQGVANIVETYWRHVLPRKTRIIHLLGRKAPAEISETLLGYEVKAFYKRIHCPDMVTARYVKLFTELGCRTIRLPYDPTVTAGLIQELEHAVAKIKSGIRDLFPQDRQLQLYVHRSLCSRLRAQLKAAAKKLPSETLEVNLHPGNTPD